MLMGFAYVEVNGRKRILMIIKNYQNFPIAPEPLNNRLATAFLELMYTAEEGCG
jgi:hypothetical protein